METSKTDTLREGYDRWAATYDLDDNPMLTIEGSHLRAAVGDVRALDVLELGCGTGRHTLWLAGCGARVTAIDLSPGMLERARQRAVGSKVPDGCDVRFIEHDLARRAPLADAAFDLIVSALVLEHLADLRAFFDDVRRLLRPAGRAVISAMHPAMLLREVRARFVDPVSGEHIEPGSHPHNLSDMVLAMLSAGLTLEHMSEHEPDAELAERHPRAAKYVGWPMLVLFALRRVG